MIKLDKTDKSFRTYRYVLITIGVLIASMFILSSTVHAENDKDAAPDDIDEEKEEGDITQHDMFEFEAFIKHGDVSFGTAPFDKDDKAGNDSADDNGIVRSWDTVTYPLKVTVNPKKADSLKNIKLKISGELENGITDKRVNAKFAVGGKEDMDAEKVSFVQDYTIERTGNSIMIPVTVEVQGAKNGVKLRPDFKVEVVSVDGEKITGVETHFDELPSATVSSKVSIKPFIGKGLAGQGLQYFPFSGITGNDDDKENMHAFGLSWGITPLPNKSNIRGATFPDPSMKLNYEINLTGKVDWDDPNLGTVSFDFNDKDAPFLLMDHRPISPTQQSVGAKHTVMEGKSYTFSRAHRYSAPLSQLAKESQSHHSVWDSGDWEIDAPDINKNVVKYDGFNTDFTIGSTFPRHRADGYTGSYLYGVNDKVFSSHAFMVLMANEYRIGGPNNKEGKANNVEYKATVKMLGYTDEDGEMVEFDNQRQASTVFTERNNPAGSMSVQTTFHSEPGNKQLGTPYIGNSVVSKGDISIINGTDVNWAGYFIHQVPLAGGYKVAYRWNTDAFELTKEYAKKAESNFYSVGYYNNRMEIVKNDKVTQKVSYGVAKFDDNSFNSFTSKGKEDYDWYDSYDEAVKHGEIGAMLNDVETFTPPSHRTRRVPLRVKHENIGVGSHTKDDTANIAVTNAYAYPTENRDREIDVSASRAYHNPAIWDETGTMVKKQSPSGSTINFDTVAVTPSETSTELTSDKKTYYNSETIKWTAKSAIVLPDIGLPDDMDAGVIVKQTLPRGLDYKANSGKMGSQDREPEIIRNSDDTTTLVWDLLVSNDTYRIPNVSFETTINPYALSPSSVQSGLQVESVIDSELDMRPENLRTSITEVTIIKVGMVGIHESIDKQYGDKNSDYTVTLSPYTTIEDEADVAGLTHIPENDKIGTKFDGSIELKDIKTSIKRTHNDDVDIYLNKSYIYDDKPNKMDMSKDGWYKYTGKTSELKDAKSIYFIVNGLMTNKDDIQIDLLIQTKDNEFGNVYMNETVINSRTDYKLSPLSDRVRYTIRPDWELSMERIQIYTNKHDKGLPVRVRIGEQVLGDDKDAIKELTFDLSLYDMTTGDRVASKKIKQKDLKSETELTIPAEVLSKDEKHNYEARIENIDTDKIWAKEPKIDTDGYTASEKVITNDDIKSGEQKAAYKGVTMTERERGQDIVKYNETITVDELYVFTVPQRTKTGYSYFFTGVLDYENEILSQVVSRVGINTDSDANYAVSNQLLDSTFEHYDAGDADGMSVMDLNTSLHSGSNTVQTVYGLDDVFIERGTGNTYTYEQTLLEENADKDFINTSMIADSSYQEKNVLYAPIWMDLDTNELFDIGFKSKDLIGSNHVSFDIDGSVEVQAHMFNHIESSTHQDDEILIHQKRNESN